MSLNRAPFDALVDDDGSNTIGTVWNKDKIKTVILDPVDALVAGWSVPTFAAAAFTGTGGMTWTVVAGNVNIAYSLHNATLTICFAISGTTVGGTVTNTLRISNAMFGGYTPARLTYGALAFITDGPTGPVAGFAEAAGAGYLNLLKTNLSPYTLSAGNTSIYGQISFQVL